MSEIERFTTADIRFEQRLEYWNWLAGETYPGTCVDQRETIFEAEMLRWKLGDLTMIRPKANACLVTRNPAGGDEDRIVLHLQHHGRSRHQQEGRMAEIRSGDFSLCRSASPYQLELTEHEFLVVEIPRAALEDRVGALDDAMARRIPGAAPGSRMLHSFFLSLWQQGDLSAADPDWQSGVAGVLVDLVGLAIQGSDMPCFGPQARRERAIRFIEANLCNPDLGVHDIAVELGVSIRTVQTMFATMGTTPNGYVLARRLARASDMLLVNPQMSITEIAFDLGFSESSYFARCFRHHYGTAPGKWRIRH